MDLSVIIPSWREPCVSKTVQSILDVSELNIEVIVISGDNGRNEPIKEDPRVKIIDQKREWGMRGSINAGLDMAKGKYIMKSDSHCLYGQGFDRIMVENCAENWLMIPRRYSVKEDTWTRDEKRTVRDYHYFSYPQLSRYGFDIAILGWAKRSMERRDAKYDIDDTMIFQGSCWLANKDYFMKNVGYLDGRVETYGSFAGEQLEVGLKYWLKSGEVKIIKKTWYAHLWKTSSHYNSGLYTRKYKRSPETTASRTWITKHWMLDEEKGLDKPFSWLIDKFMPIPTWEKNWQELIRKHIWI